MRYLIGYLSFPLKRNVQQGCPPFILQKQHLCVPLSRHCPQQSNEIKMFPTLPPLISPSCHNVVFKISFHTVNAIVFFSKLGVHLPHPVDSKNGKAQWDKDRELLTVTVQLVREYDFLTK